MCRSPRGGRGLKFLALARAAGVLGSLSSRRAWIEIPLLLLAMEAIMVALLAEGVD